MRGPGAATLEGAQHLVVGTAGHIDHGKTTLVRGLTGVDLDRLPEEQSRGITIALGFTHLALPSGRVASFVDVPGHERLVRTMIAGATGLDVALLCVSACEGSMPQTREHLAILELLGVQRGVVALTMTDLADEEMCELARLDVEELVQGTFLEGAPVVSTAVHGDRVDGLDALVEALDGCPDVDHDEQGPVRLPIDRAFVQRGFGTVVTGTIRSGRLTDGEVVEVLPEKIAARVRGLQVHGQAVDASRKGLRTAVNLAGIERGDLARGSVVVRRGSVPIASILDGRVELLADAPAIPDGGRVRLLVGTAEVMAVVSVLDAPDHGLQPGRSHWIQLRTDAPVVALPGDRFILRRESPVQTLGGGRVLDPWSRRVRRRNYRRVLEELEALEGGDRLVFLDRAGDAGLGVEEVRLRSIVGGTALGDRVLHPERVAHLEESLDRALQAWHRAHALVRGAPRRELHATFPALSERAFDALLQRGSDQGRLVLDGPRVRAGDFSVCLTEEEQRRRDGLEDRVRSAGLEGPGFSEIVSDEPELLQLLLDGGSLQRVGPMVVHRQALTSLEAQVRGFFTEQSVLRPIDFKTLTSLTRKHAIPLLEWLDGRGITRREEGGRVLR
ncbi:MAG: selenocysteine-specific translation elongation factor [Myxococcota bacterium]|nr:selenocysteine-specific translation elongation factor [Myxococcota bacterium]